MNHSIDPNRDSDLMRDGGLARIERTFTNLFNLFKARTERRDQLQRQVQEKRLTRGELFRQVQHEKWLGGSRAPQRRQSPAQPPKDLYKRVLLDPNAVDDRRKTGAKAGR